LSIFIIYETSKNNSKDNTGIGGTI
jgi:hypothetical protein